MFYTRVAWEWLVCLLLCREEGSSPVSAITERKDMSLYEVPLFVSLLGFGIIIIIIIIYNICIAPYNTIL